MAASRDIVGDGAVDSVQEAQLLDAIIALQQRNGRRYDVVVSTDGGWRHDLNPTAGGTVVAGFVAGFEDGSTSSGGFLKPARSNTSKRGRKLRLALIADHWP